MLQYLRIRNFGLFEDAELELEPGFTVFTGETGAGKSMLIDALMACFGYRTSAEVIRAGADRAVAEVLIIPQDPSILAEFQEQLEDLSEITLQRDILPERSYLRINGRVSTASVAQGLGARLLDIHGQQQHHSLLKPSSYLPVLDSIAKDKVQPLLSKYRALYAQRQKILEELSGLSLDDTERSREIDLLTYQVNEITSAALKPEEEDELKRRYNVLSYQQKLIDLTSQAYDLVYSGASGLTSAFELIGQARELMRKASQIDEGAKDVVSSLSEAEFALENACDSIRNYQKSLSVDEREISKIEERLDLISRLKEKYGSSVEKILSYCTNAKQKLDRLLKTDEVHRELESSLENVTAELNEVGSRLSVTRREQAKDMEEHVTLLLRALDMPSARFKVEIERLSEPSPDGFDKVSFMFSANPGTGLLPLYKVASGGELSRLMLALKSYTAQVDPVPTMIFDEIDTGVGGRAAAAVAEAMWKLGRSHQVFCVTHLATIAAMADSHFVVSKCERDGKTFARVDKVDGEERVREIARMLSGSDLKASIDHAREILSRASSRKAAKF